MEYSEKYIAEFIRGLDPFSILILVNKAELRRLFCPFKAEVLLPVGNLRAGDKVSVEAVKITLDVSGNLQCTKNGK